MQFKLLNDTDSPEYQVFHDGYDPEEDDWTTLIFLTPELKHIMNYREEPNHWYYEGAADPNQMVLTADELRRIANKLDELEAKESNDA